MIGERVEWHRRGERTLTDAEYHQMYDHLDLLAFPGSRPRIVPAFSVTTDVLGDAEPDAQGVTGVKCPRLAHPSTWHETDVVCFGVIAAFDANVRDDARGGTVLLKKDDGTFASVPVLCIRAVGSPSSRRSR